MEPQKLELTAVATFYCDKMYPYEAARQGSIDNSQSLGEIRFFKEYNYLQALEGIEGFSHLWVIYQFHHNQNWKPKVSPPRGSENKVGVFATRAPYRPNALGLSCLELVKVEGLSLWVRGFDLLNETPIFDIKPYVTYADSFPEARLGWLENSNQEKYTLSFSALARKQIEFIKSAKHPEIESFIANQLEVEPFNSNKKRVSALSDVHGVLAYRTWRIEFALENKKICVQRLFSGYSKQDLENSEDKYQDKKIHQQFQASPDLSGQQATEDSRGKTL